MIVNGQQVRKLVRFIVVVPGTQLPPVMDKKTKN